MVKWSNNTPKSGKWANPTDQVRKAARKRELKKNKKQREMMRAAILKGKDPLQILSDMEKIDEMEYSVISQPLLNQQVLKDKRKKMKETWDRVMQLYSKENRERYLELNKLEIAYKTKRSELMKQFESVRATQYVQLDEIPLPSKPNAPSILTPQTPLPNELNVPSNILPAPQSILKKGLAYFGREQYLSSVQPPGVPPGPPPDLSSDEDEVDDGPSMAVEAKKSKSGGSKSKSRKVRFADESGGTGVNTNEEVVERSTDASVSVSAEADSSVDTNLIPSPADIPLPSLNHVALSSGPLPGMLQLPPPMLTRPPPLGSVMPPGLRLHLGVPPFRLPPGPPPLRPIRPPPPLPRLPAELSQATSQLQAAPNFMQKPRNIAPSEGKTKRATTIEAKPQIRNLSADALHFVPTTLRVKRVDGQKKSGGNAGMLSELSNESYKMAPVSNPSASVPTKDNAYQQFLLEMEGFL